MTPTLEARKRELLCESELNRKVLEIETGQWELRTARWQTRASTAQKYWSFLGPLAQLCIPAKYSSMLGIARAFLNFRK
jgi:hypothetical protein